MSPFLGHGNTNTLYGGNKLCRRWVLSRDELWTVMGTWRGKTETFQSDSSGVSAETRKLSGAKRSASYTWLSGAQRALRSWLTSAPHGRRVTQDASVRFWCVSGGGGTSVKKACP